VRLHAVLRILKLVYLTLVILVLKRMSLSAPAQRKALSVYC
jgi:hypothetical protein